MLNNYKVQLLTTLAIITSIVTILACNFVAEKFFFDKFYYYKNPTYGYPSKDRLEQYNLRSKDLVTLHSSPDALFNYQENSYNIVIFGDSYVYGQGIKNQDRFVNLLDKKLNQVRKTKVVVLSETSRSPIDYLNWYRKIPHPDKVDLYIFALVNNDAFIRHDQYGKVVDDTGTVALCQRKTPQVTPVPDVALTNFFTNYHPKNINELNALAFENSWTNPVNQCTLKESLYNLPTDKAIYFITDDYLDIETKFSLYRNILTETKKQVISSSVGKKDDKYNKYWQSNPRESFKVSKMEEHPNSLANQMYADILYNEIINHPKYKF